MAKKGKILVVEDNDFVRMQVVKFLQEDNYSVEEATDGEVALSMVGKDSGVCLALVDIRMEPIGGIEFLKIIRGKNINIPVIVITSYDTGDILEQSGKLDVAAVLIKPVMKERLLKMVERTLDNVVRATN